MNRRSFCQCVAAGLGAGLIDARSPAAAARRAGAAPPIVAVIYDERCADAHEFAAILRRHGAAAFAFRGDCSGFWYGEAASALRRQRCRIAGMTTYADFQVAKSCAGERELRPIFEGIHDARGSERVIHRYRLAAGARRLASTSALSPGELAEILTGVDDGGAQGWSIVEATGPMRPEQSGYWTSWLLGPRNSRLSAPSYE